MNKVLIFASMLVLTIGCKKGQEQQGAGMGATQKVLPTITVGEQSTTSNLSFPVNIEGVVNSPVQAKISGYITKVLVDEGQAVRQGQPMFQLETQTLNQSAASAKAQVEVARVEVNRLLPLVEKNIVSKVQLETAQANLQRAQAAYNEVASNIGFAVVKAPVNGVVGAIQYREGALVTANNTILTTVSDVKDVYAYFSMNEKDYLLLAQIYAATVVHKGKGTLGAGLEGLAEPKHLKQVRLDKFTLGGKSFKNPTCLVASDVPTILGAEVLRYGIVTIDYPRGRFYFQPYKQSPVDLSKAAPIWSVSILPARGKFEIATVWEPLIDRVDIGDEVIAVNGKDITRLPLSEIVVSDIFDQITSSEATITIRRKKRKFDINIYRR